MDDYRLHQMLLIIKKWLTEKHCVEFKSFDFTNDPLLIHGDSFKVQVHSSEEVIYFLTHYKLNSHLKEQDIDNLLFDKGFKYSQWVSLILFL